MSSKMTGCKAAAERGHGGTGLCRPCRNMSEHAGTSRNMAARAGHIKGSTGVLPFMSLFRVFRRLVIAGLTAPE